MIFERLTEKKLHEIQIVYNMDDAQFVLRYEQETIQLNTIKRTAVSITEIAVFFYLLGNSSIS